MLDDCEGVICVSSGHINTHEAGAIEFTGHKVLPLAHEYGKLSANELSEYLDSYFSDENYDHAVIPGMVYISHPTEYGTLYSLTELTEISDVCKRYKIPLYLDGARLGYAVASDGTDVSIKDISRLCDAFYIGGTKVGALCGEALVFSKNNAPKHFFTKIKQHGALLAKGRLLGIQFDVLFTNDLYFKISRHAIEMANKMRKLFAEKGYEFFIETVTNQIFVVLEKEQYNRLSKLVSFGFWECIDDQKTVVRFATSWATEQADIDKLAEIL